MSLITGKISWFGGPQDKTTGPTTASGAPTSTPGIAVYNQSTLGGYWLLRMPNGHGVVVKQTDIGPAPSTGRTFDFTYSLLPLLGYNTSNFPTNQSVRGVYLGKTIQDVVDYMVQEGLEFASAVPGDEGAYRALHSALASYNMQVNSQLAAAGTTSKE